MFTRPGNGLVHAVAPAIEEANCGDEDILSELGSPVRMRSMTVAPPRMAGTITWR